MSSDEPDDPIPVHRDSQNEVELAQREVEGELEDLGDPEAAPTTPASTLAAHSAGASLRGDASPLADERPSAELLRLALPVMLSMALANTGNMVDRAMIGWLNGGVGAAKSLAAAAYATQFFFVIQSALLAVGLACVAVMARAIGARDTERAQAAFAASMQVAAGVALVLTVLFLAAARPGLALMGAEPDVAEATLPYLYCLLSSTLLLTFCLIVDSALRAKRDTITPMLVAFGITAVKLSANAVFIYGWFGFPAMGLTGAGLASLLAQGVGVGLFVWALRREASDSPARLVARAWRGATSLRRDIVRIALPGVAERLVMSASQLAYFSVLSHSYGTVAVAAYAVGVPLLSFTWIPGMGYAQASATLVGQALGANREDLARRIGWTAAGVAVATALLVGGPVALARDWFANLFTGDADVIAELGPFLLTLALTQPFLQLHFTLGGAHRGAGDTVTPLIAATTSNALRFGLAWVCATVLELPVIYVWGAIFVDHFFRAAFLVFTFRSGRWLRVGARAHRG